MTDDRRDTVTASPTGSAPPAGAGVAPTATAALRDALRAALTSGVGGRHVRRAWPADLDEPEAGLVLELADGDRRCGARILLGPDGTARTVLDATDPVLGDLPEGRLVGLRPGKRAVVRDAGGRFVKVATRKATRRALRRAATVESLLSGAQTGRGAVPSPALPARPVVADVDPTGGRLVLDPLPGRPLAAVLATGDVDAAGRAGAAIGDALAALQRTPEVGDAGLPTYTATDEATTLRRWAASALALAPLSREDAAALRDETPAVAAALDDLRDVPRRLAHRDLHDGQILLEDTRDGLAVGVLDWDTAAFADPEIDVANLLAHVDRSARRGETSPRVAEAFEAALVAPLILDGTRLDPYRRATALRLRAVHGFRRSGG